MDVLDGVGSLESGVVLPVAQAESEGGSRRTRVQGCEQAAGGDKFHQEGSHGRCLGDWLSPRSGLRCQIRKCTARPHRERSPDCTRGLPIFRTHAASTPPMAWILPPPNVAACETAALHPSGRPKGSIAMTI